MARKHLSHIKSKLTENGGPKLPTPSQLIEGEIAVNFAKGYETLSILNSDSGITTFSNDITLMSYIDEQDLEIVNGAGLSVVSNSQASGITNYQYVPDSGDTILSGATSLKNADHILSQTILDNEIVIARALNDLEDRKLDASAYTPTDLSNYYTKTEVDTALSGKQDTLISGTNIKTVNNTTLLGSGNIDADDVVMGKLDGTAFYKVTGYTGLNFEPQFSSTPETGNQEKIYVDILTDKAYRWKNVIGGNNYKLLGEELSIITDGEINSLFLSTNKKAVSAKVLRDNFYTETEVDNALSRKQDTLIAGDGIDITDNEISTNGGIIYLDGYESPDNNTQHDPVSEGNTVNEAFANIVSAMTDNELHMLEVLSGINESIDDMSIELNGKADASDVYTINQVDGLLAGKQNTLIAGNGIEISSANVISATIAVDSELDSGSTNPVANSAITLTIIENENIVASALTELNDRKLDASAYTEYDDSQLRYLIALKQDVLTAGNGIQISGNVISSTIQVTEFVNALPVEGVPGRIYFVPDPNSPSQENAFVEYAWTTGNTWEIVGKWMPDINIDTELSTGSTNPVANSAITQAIIDDERIMALALNDLDNRKLDASAYTPYDDTEVRNLIAQKQDPISAGTGINITNNVVSSTLVIDSALNTGSTNPVANSAITAALDSKQGTISGGSGISISNNVVSIDPFVVSGTATGQYDINSNAPLITTDKTFNETKENITAGVPTFLNVDLGSGAVMIGPLEYNGTTIQYLFYTGFNGTYDYLDVVWTSGTTLYLEPRWIQPQTIGDSDVIGAPSTAAVHVQFGNNVNDTAVISLLNVECGDYAIEVDDDEPEPAEP